ncbi:MAG: PEGA domain-containing protein [Candidatus Saccharibacteria bacterium]
MNSRKIIKISAIVFGLLCIGLIIYYLIPKSYIRFSVAPKSVYVSINNNKQTINNGDTITVSPGKYSITISQKEFESYTKEIELKNGETNDILLVLTPITDSAIALLNDPSIQDVIESSTIETRNKEVANNIKNNPILNILPITDKYYTATSCPSEKYPNNNSKIAVCIELTHTDEAPDADLKDYALENIKKSGYDPATLEIIWTN